MSQISFDDLFSDERREETKIDTLTSIPPSLSPIEKDVYTLLQSGETSALRICEELVKTGKLPSGRFSTNKPKAYPDVCMALESLVQQGKLFFVEDKDKHDRIYRLKD